MSRPSLSESEPEPQAASEPAATAAATGRASICLRMTEAFLNMTIIVNI